MRFKALAILLLCSCPIAPPAQKLDVTARVFAHNARGTATTVHVAFGSDSAITADDWSFCSGSGLVCSFPLAAGKSQTLDTSGKYLNATLAFDMPVGCGATKAELNINNPSWADTLDVSLVDGYNNKISIDTEDANSKAVTLGPPLGQFGNEKVYGLFPNGCDICVERLDPPCGIPKGKTGCKTGTQDNPDVICQYQAPVVPAKPPIVVTLH